MNFIHLIHVLLILYAERKFCKRHCCNVHKKIVPRILARCDMILFSKQSQRSLFNCDCVIGLDSSCEVWFSTKCWPYRPYPTLCLTGPTRHFTIIVLNFYILQRDVGRHRYYLFAIWGYLCVVIAYVSVFNVRI